MKKSDYKNWKSTMKSKMKDCKCTYKAERPPLKERILKTVKSIITKVKIFIKTILKAWTLIVELKGEIIKLKDEIEGLESTDIKKSICL